MALTSREFLSYGKQQGLSSGMQTEPVQRCLGGRTERTQIQPCDTASTALLLLTYVRGVPGWEANPSLIEFPWRVLHVETMLLGMNTETDEPLQTTHHRDGL